MRLDNLDPLLLGFEPDGPTQKLEAAVPAVSNDYVLSVSEKVKIKRNSAPQSVIAPVVSELMVKRAKGKNGRGRPRRQTQGRKKKRQNAVTVESKHEEEGTEDSPGVWIQCCKCNKWRYVGVELENGVPEFWECSMNKVNRTYNIGAYLILNIILTAE